MTDRTRPARDIRILPGPSKGAAATASSTSAASAVQLFRALAAQASLLTDANGDAASSMSAEPHINEPDGAAAGTSSDANAPGREIPNDASSAPPEHAATLDEAPDLPAAAPKLRAAGTARRRNAAPQPDDPALGEQIVRACASAAHGEVFTQQLAERIARFCSMSGAADDAAWEVTLPMNPAVLPDTSMHLQLSPSRIVIRFETANPHASRLIVDNADALRVRLADVLSRQIDVDVIA